MRKKERGRGREREKKELERGGETCAAVKVFVDFVFLWRLFESEGMVSVAGKEVCKLPFLCSVPLMVITKEK